MVGRQIGTKRILKIGVGNRVTVPSDIVEFFNLKKGTNIEIEFKAAYEDDDIIESMPQGVPTLSSFNPSNQDGVFFKFQTTMTGTVDA